jgi:hypothetical protein
MEVSHVFVRAGGAWRCRCGATYQDDGIWVTPLPSTAPPGCCCFLCRPCPMVVRAAEDMARAAVLQPGRYTAEDGSEGVRP